MLDWLIFGFVGWAIPFLIMRKKGGRGRSIVAYILGFVTTFILTFAALLFLEEAAHVPPLQANHVVGPGICAAILGPALGLWTAIKARVANSANSGPIPSDRVALKGPERLPWYRARNYKGNFTEAEKRQLDAFRAQPKHPATRTEDLPEEVQDYINRIELELYDHKQQDAVGQAFFYSLIGAALLALHYTGCLKATPTPWIYAFDVLILVSPWFFYGYRWKKNAEEFHDPTDEVIRKEWEIIYVIAMRGQQRDAASP